MPIEVVKKFRSPYEAFQTSALRVPDAPFLLAPRSAALAYAPDGFRVTYGELSAQVDDIKARLAAAGYGQGTRVALMLDNRPEFFAHWLALNALGCSIVPINPDLRPDELSFQLQMSSASLLIATGDRLAAAGLAERGRAGLIEVGDVIPPCPADIEGQSASLDSECAILFTSGSTGKPKGCMLSNRYFLKTAEWYLNQGGSATIAEANEINFTPLPMFHMNGLGCSAVGMMAIGGAVVPVDRFHASRWWASVGESGATIVHCLGVIPAILLQLPPSEWDRKHSVRFAFAPGVDVRHRALFEERFGIPIVDAWAMTETGGAASTTTAREPKGFPARCIGRPAEDMEYKLVDDLGQPAVDGKPGELLVRSKGPAPRLGFFSGYVNDSVSTEEAWEGGWFHTGDYVFVGPDGLLYFFDRKKSIVRRSGENIGVLEVESVLQQIDGVAAVAVTPVPDELRGEEVFAFIVKHDDAKADQQAAQVIVDACARVLAYHKVPAYIAYVDTLPLSATKKLARGEIKVLATKAVADAAVIDLRSHKAGLRVKAEH